MESKVHLVYINTSVLNIEPIKYLIWKDLKWKDMCTDLEEKWVSAVSQ